MSKKPRRRPDILTRTPLPDGRVHEVQQTWQEAHSSVPEFVQWSHEHVYLHNQILSQETDRAVAVLGPAYLDTLLEDLLRAYLRETKSVEVLLQASGPLGSFSTRIDLTHALGLLDDDAANDLHLIRKIRNEFAHSVDVHDFNADEIKSRCRELKAAKFWGKDCFDFGKLTTARQVFLTSIGLAVSEIANGMRYAKRRTVVPPIRQPDENWKGF